jgi:hypothetical protein
MAKKAKQPQTLYDKVNKIDPQFAAEVHSLTDEQLKEKIMQISKYESELEDAKAQDPDLKEARERVQVAMESYKEPLKASKLKKKLVLQILTERGKV